MTSKNPWVDRPFQPNLFESEGEGWAAVRISRRTWFVASIVARAASDPAPITFAVGSEHGLVELLEQHHAADLLELLCFIPGEGSRRPQWSTRRGTAIWIRQGDPVVVVITCTDGKCIVGGALDDTDPAELALELLAEVRFS